MKLVNLYGLGHIHLLSLPMVESGQLNHPVDVFLDHDADVGTTGGVTNVVNGYIYGVDDHCVTVVRLQVSDQQVRHS